MKIMFIYPYFILTFSSCGKNKTNIGGKVSRFKQIGEITPDFGNENLKLLRMKIGR